MGNDLRSAKNGEEQFYQALDEESLDSVPFVWLLNKCRHSHGVSLLIYDTRPQLFLSVRKLGSNWQETELVFGWRSWPLCRYPLLVYPSSSIAEIVSIDRNSLVVEGLIEDRDLPKEEQGRQDFVRVCLTLEEKNSHQCVPTTYMFYRDNHLRENKDANQVFKLPRSKDIFYPTFRRIRFRFLEPVIQGDPSFENKKRKLKLYDKNPRDGKRWAHFHSWTGPIGLTVLYVFEARKVHVRPQDWYAVAMDPI